MSRHFPYQQQQHKEPSDLYYNRPTTFAYPTNAAYAWYSAKSACWLRPGFVGTAVAQQNVQQLNNIQATERRIDRRIASVSAELYDPRVPNTRTNIDDVPIQCIEDPFSAASVERFGMVPTQPLFEPPFA